MRPLTALTVFFATLAPFAAALAFVASANAQTPAPLVIACDDPVFARDSSHARLAEKFGAANVTSQKTATPAGMKQQADTIVFAKDPARRLRVQWQDQSAQDKPFAFIVARPSRWIAPKGVAIGQGIAALERANGKPFAISGFGGTLDGMTSFSGGALERLPGGCAIGVTMRPTIKRETRNMRAVAGDSEFRSTDRAMRATRPAVTQVQVVYQPPR